MQARGEVRLGNSHDEKAPFHRGHSLFSYSPLPSLQSGSDWLFRGENEKGRRAKKGAGRRRAGAAGARGLQGTTKKVQIHTTKTTIHTELSH